MAKSNSRTFLIVAVVLVLVLLAFLLITYNKSSEWANENFTNMAVGGAQRGMSIADIGNQSASPDAAASGLGVVASDPYGNEVYNPIKESGDFAAPSCYPRDRLTAEDLLPKDAANSKWARMNPAGQGEVSNQNFLTAGYHIGVNTQGSSMRNSNYQLRSEPVNPQVVISPWNQSTIDPDLLRRPLEINEA